MLLSPVPCVIVTCPANAARFCGAPSLIDIGQDGRCKTGARFIVTASKVTKSRLVAPVRV